MPLPPLRARRLAHLAYALSLVLMCSAAKDAQAAPAPTTAAMGPSAAPADAPQGPSLYETDTPPPTAYDQQAQHAPLGLAREDRTLLWYGLRVVTALGATLLCIVLTVRLVLPRVIPNWNGAGAKHLALVERLALDGRNAVMLLRVGADAHILVGTGEHGVKFLADMPEPSPKPREHFATSMAHAPHALDRPDDPTHVPAH